MSCATKLGTGIGITGLLNNSSMSSTTSSSSTSSSSCVSALDGRPLLNEITKLQRCVIKLESEIQHLKHQNHCLMLEKQIMAKEHQDTVSMRNYLCSLNKSLVQKLDVGSSSGSIPADLVSAQMAQMLKEMEALKQRVAAAELQQQQNAAGSRQKLGPATRAATRKALQQ